MAGIVGKKVNWVLDADFSDYFSSLDHQWLVRFLEHRIADRRVLGELMAEEVEEVVGPNGRP